jgi:hypothetical protein
LLVRITCQRVTVQPGTAMTVKSMTKPASDLAGFYVFWALIQIAAADQEEFCWRILAWHAEPLPAYLFLLPEQQQQSDKQSPVVVEMIRGLIFD